MIYREKIDSKTMKKMVSFSHILGDKTMKNKNKKTNEKKILRKRDNAKNKRNLVKV